MERWIGSDLFCFEVADLAEREENAETEIQPSTDKMHATVMRRCRLAIGKADLSPINEMQPPEIREHPLNVPFCCVVRLYIWVLCGVPLSLEHRTGSGL